MRAIDQVRHHAPANAVTYRLSHKLSDGSTVTTPKASYLPLRLSPPLGMASGTYMIHYFAESGEQIRDANQALFLNSEEEKGQTQLHIALGTGGPTSGSAHFANAGGERDDATSDSDDDLAASAGSGADDDAEYRTELVEDEDDPGPEMAEDEGAPEVADDAEEQAERALERRIKEQTQMFVLQMRQQELHNKFLLKSQGK